MPKPKKQAKPYPDFPLTAHRNGQWCKKIRGKIHYFGTDADAALQKYLDQRDDLQAGRQPQATTGFNLADMVNSYLSDVNERREAGELTMATFSDYRVTGVAIVDHFGRNIAPERIRPTQFTSFRNKLAKQYAPSRVGKMVTQTKMMFKWAFESELIESVPNFGPNFKSTSKRAARLAKAERENRLLTAEQIRQLLKSVDDWMHTAILLGINGGLGNNDVSELCRPMINFRKKQIIYPRPKTGVMRRIPLWPETIKALKRSIKERPAPSRPELEDRVLLSARGESLVKPQESGNRTDNVGVRFDKLLRDIGVMDKGIGFYTLRHCFQTEGDEARDTIATSSIMGHVDGSTGGNYREKISDERLRAVTDHVRAWLFAGVDDENPDVVKFRQAAG